MLFDTGDGGDFRIHRPPPRSSPVAPSSPPAGVVCSVTREAFDRQGVQHLLPSTTPRRPGSGNASSQTTRVKQIGHPLRQGLTLALAQLAAQFQDSVTFRWWPSSAHSSLQRRP